MLSSILEIETPRKFLPFLDPARYKGAHGGRGSGKSHFFAEMLIERCKLKPGTRAACVREVQKSLKHSVKLLVEDKIRKFGLQGEFEILEAEIRTPGGGVIIFQGMQNHTADSIKSLEGFDIAWVEEAQSLSQRSLDLLRPTIRAPGSELWFTWNPNKPTDPVDVLFRGEAAPKDATVVEVNADDNPWFPPELRADMDDDRERDYDKYLHVWRGAYNTNSEARVFKNWVVREFETPKDAEFRFGADWGFATDPTVLIRGFVDGRKLYVDYEAWGSQVEIDHIPALFAGDDTQTPKRWENPKKFPGIPGSHKWIIRADSARPETISFVRRREFRIVPAIKGPGSLEDGVEFLKSFDIIVHPRCVNTINELTYYSYKQDPLTEEILPVLEDKDNHTIDALRYALEALRRVSKRPAPRAKNVPVDRFRPAPVGDNGWKVA